MWGLLSSIIPSVLKSIPSVVSGISKIVRPLGTFAMDKFIRPLG